MDKAFRFGLIMGALLVLSFLVVIRLSHTAPRLGLRDGKLLPCPGSPNCYTSEHAPGKGLQLYDYPPKEAWQLLINIVKAEGGKIIEQNDFYLRAEFYSKWWRFVDDLEARLDREEAVIHLRSASRFGHYDFNVNRKRVDVIKKKMNVYLQPVVD